MFKWPAYSKLSDYIIIQLAPCKQCLTHRHRSNNTTLFFLRFSRFRCFHSLLGTVVQTATFMILPLVCQARLVLQIDNTRQAKQHGCSNRFSIEFIEQTLVCIHHKDEAHIYVSWRDCIRSSIKPGKKKKISLQKSSWIAWKWQNLIL